MYRTIRFQLHPSLGRIAAAAAAAATATTSAATARLAHRLLGGRAKNRFDTRSGQSSSSGGAARKYPTRDKKRVPAGTYYKYLKPNVGQLLQLQEALLKSTLTSSSIIEGNFNLKILTTKLAMD